ncbi:ParA family protein [Salinarimonas soli]|uniref:AAA family ATPase n=1 Tax=Salinarimonas soli TaxID=1638099 RepID=A0A5B2VD81_9HYPH|nr:AAA family ATPase [Salinarimonas soli]KAA2236430.1 AAA family ATPase [Salinarimonas soli]
MAVVVSLFNHKGGVSKTTTAFNLGWMLARKGQRVMLVDCDPQCNLTGMVLGFERVEDADTVLAPLGGKPRNIRDGLAPAFESRPSLIQAVQCVTVPGNDNLFLLPGHIGLAEYEVTLGIAQELSGSVMTLRNLPGSLRYLIDKTAGENGIDIVLIDMSPSLGAVNQNLLTTSDYFIVPMHPDYFSMMAIESLSSVLPKWRAWSEAAKSLPILKQAEYPFPEISPKFMGYVVQKYRPRGNSVPSQAFQQWIDQIENGVRDRLIPALEKAGMMLDEGTYAAAGFNPSEPMLQMSDFNSLIARSQEHQVPVFELTDAQIEQVGVVLGTTKESMERFKTLFANAADRVISIISSSL